MNVLNSSNVKEAISTQVTPDQPGSDNPMGLPVPNYPNSTLMPSGWRVVVPIPVLRNSNTPLFVVRLSPVVGIPDESAQAVTIRDAVNNYFFAPVQMMKGGVNEDIKILYDPVPTEHYHNMVTHRAMSGQIDLVLRLSSNTNVTGSIILTEAQEVERDLAFADWGVQQTNPAGIRYQGFAYSNQLPTMLPTLSSNFALNDTSLTRHFEVSTTYSTAQPYIDHYWWYNTMGTSNTAGVAAQNVVPFFRENIVLVSAETDITTAEVGQLVFDLLWDFSKVTYHNPIAPMWPYRATRTIASMNRPALDFTERYVVPTKAEETTRQKKNKKKWLENIRSVVFM